MRDKVLTRAIIISAVVHLVAIGFIGRTSNTRLNASVITPAQQHLMNVDLVKDPYADPPKPKPVVVQPKPDTPAPQPKQGFFAGLAAKVFGPSRPVPASVPVRVSNRAGGALNTGTADRNGDLAGLRSGNTSVGTVPGSDNGRGNGHGDAPGVNRADPPAPAPRPAYVAPSPAPQPPPPPAPRKVTRTVCEVSGMLAGEYCKNKREATFTEGDEPRHTCDRCKAPEPVHVNKIADRANPLLTHDVRPRIPDSIEEGLSLETEIEYYVDADGSVSGVRVSRSSGNRDWDRAVTSAASQWRYNPAVQDGTPRKVKVTRSIRCKT